MLQKVCIDEKNQNRILHYNLQWFAKDGEGGEKTEPATAKKLKDARDEGKVAKSRELNSAFDLIVLFLCLKIFVSFVGEKFIDIFSYIYENMPDFVKINEGGLSVQAVAGLIASVTLKSLLIMLPFMAFGFVVTLLVSIVQVGWKVSTKPMKPELSKLNPLNGFKRIFSKDSLFELVKSILKIVIIIYIAYTSIKDNANDLFALYDLGLNQAVALVGTLIINTGIKISIVYLVIGLADFIYQKHKFNEDMKMTKQEVKDEYKNTEGDPQIKGRQRRKMQEVSQKRMMQDVPKADVVITNPTHFAVALKYEAKVSSAPVVLAKGEDYLAQKIKEVARENKIEIVENKPLARMLYHNVDVGAEIPPELYQAVAEVLAAVYKAKNIQSCSYTTNRCERRLCRMLKKADIGVGLYLLAAVVFFIVPIPSVLLDVMLAFNISIALIIVFNVLFVREVLDMSFFPTLLLFTTIFRISLNVSSTRLILLTGDPGNVVKTFGSFVGGGNMVVGSIVFIVLVLIQFIVINKGSERVSEVTARFTLDAMPGKQMAIDADLNTGAITDAEAKERREKIQRESSFFGAMDGATKYVKGDATAGLVITFINLIGGTIMGVMNQGLGFADAIQQYGLLTIGDGLVSQIPSLLISLATGILVTKGSNEADFSGILVKQLFGIPRVLYIVGSVLVFLGIFTPLNPVLFIALGLVFIIAGKNISKNIGEENIEEEVQQAETEAEEIRKPENVVSLLQVDPIELEFGYGIIPLADVNQGGDLLDRVVMIRRQIALELGTVVPIIRLRDNIQLNPNQYIIKIKGVQVTEGEILFDHYMAMNPGYVEEEITGIPTFEPSFHLPAIWITEAQRERAESLGYTVVDAPSIIATHLTEVIRSHIAELLTRQDVQNLVNNLKESNPVLVDELTPKLLGLGEIQKVLQNLLREGISIRDLLSIFESLADHAQTSRDTDVLTEYVRQSLKRAISSKYFPSNETTSVITLDPKVEQEIMSSVKQTEQGAYLTMDPEKTKAIMDSVRTETEKLESLGKNPIIITSPIVRMYFKKLTEDYFKDLIVVSYNEVESDVELQSVGMVTA